MHPSRHREGPGLVARTGAGVLLQGPPGVAPDFGIRIAAGHATQPFGGAAIRGLAAQEVRRRPAHPHAAVARGQIEQQRRHVDRQRRRLAGLAAEAVQGVPAHAGHRILQEAEEAGEAALVRVVIEQRRAPLAHPRVGVGEAGDERVERQRAGLLDCG